MINYSALFLYSTYEWYLMAFIVCGKWPCPCPMPLLALPAQCTIVWFGLFHPYHTCLACMHSLYSCSGKPCKFLIKLAYYLSLVGVSMHACYPCVSCCFLLENKIFWLFEFCIWCWYFKVQCELLIAYETKMVWGFGLTFRR